MSTGVHSSGLNRRALVGSGALGLGRVLAGCLTPLAHMGRSDLTDVASADRSWVQVAVSPGGRIFVNFSRWFGPLSVAVAEVMPDGSLRPYPDAGFNGDAGPAGGRAISVQSVVMDPDGLSLWIVDAGNPQLAGPIPGGAKLVQVDLATNRIVRTLPLGADVAPAGSYLADLRIDARRRVGYLPDLALGAIAVVDMTGGRGRRVLESHVSTQAEDLTLIFDGKPWLYPDGSRPKTAATSIALSPDTATLYYKPLVGQTLYQFPTSALSNLAVDAGAAVSVAVAAHPSDAIAFGPDGALYLTAIDREAITRWRPGEASVTAVLEDPRLAWPVGLTFGPDGQAYTTIGRIHEGGSPRDRYRLYRFTPKGF